jgi:transaldolase
VLEREPELWRQEVQLLARDFAKDDVEGVYWATYLDLVRRGAAMIARTYEASGGKYGFLSGQVDPRFTQDAERMLRQGLEIAAQGENVMVKIPGSRQGYEVLEELTARGISTNNTTSFTVSQYVHCMNAVSRGLERARAAAIDLSRWRSVITHMSARLGNLGDLQDQAKARGISLTPEDILWGETAVIKRAYRYGKDSGHPSKMLQCSMRVTDNPATGKASSWHIEKLAGGDFVYTCPGSYIEELMQVEDRMNPFDPAAIDEEVPQLVLDKLLRLPYFRQAYEFDGMKPDEFANFGAFVATASQFAAATRRTIDFVACTLAS